MDIGNLVTQKESNEGKWFPVILYGKRQPFAINIFGSDSDAVTMFEREQFRKLRESKKDLEELSDEMIDEITNSKIDTIVARMNGLKSIKWGNLGNRWEFSDEPITMNGVELKSDEKSYRLLLENIPELRDFIKKKSGERTNFLSDRKKD